ncbi:MAG: RHS repeat-associated core domain-containing protein [Bryobacterales bacterium]|nr:RHS repeat-associated core domain-containing protein [Bryobacterales bacterium]
MTLSYHQPGAAPQVGRLKLTSAGASPNLSSTELTWDALGRVTSNKQRITGNANDYILNYTYYLNDAINQLTYPSGKSVTYTLDDAGRDLELKQGTTRSLARIATSPDPTGWSAHGAVTDIQLGNGLWESHEFNSRLQKHRSRLGTVRAPAQPADTLLDIQLNFPGQNNNGNPSNQVIRTAGREWTQNYGYDGVNRLTSASEMGDDYTNGFNETYNYDAFGNRWVTGTSPGTDNQQPSQESHYNAANNRLAGNPGPYDSVGNLTTFGPFTLTYDQEGHVVTATGGANGSAAFAYDGDGRRVRKDFTINGSTTSTYYVYDAGGNLAAEYSNSLQSTSDTHFRFLDWLGTTRAVVDQGKGFVARYDYTPFGRLIASSSSPVFMLGRNAIPGYPTEPKSLGRQTHLFTGKERDKEIGDAGLDYFAARYFSAAQGRFTSPDKPLSDQNARDPQSWNLYAYVRNNPLRFVDPTGMKCVNGVHDKTGDACFEATGSTRQDNASPGGIVAGFFKSLANLLIGAYNVTSDITEQVDGIPNGAISYHRVTPFAYRSTAEDRGAVIGATVTLLGSGLERLGQRTAEIAFSSRAVAGVAKEIQGGATAVRVATKSDAEELFLRLYQGAGYRNSTGMSATEPRTSSGVSLAPTIGIPLPAMGQ